MTGTGIIIGLVGAILFRIRNDDKRFLNILSALIFLIFLSETLFLTVFDYPVALTYSIITGGLFLVFYFIRYAKKDKKVFIDYLKVIAVLLISAYPISFMYPYNWGEIVVFIAAPFSFIIYIYDRFILKPETMKKKFVIILAIQTILLGLFFIYAFVQKLEADTQREIAEMMQQETEKNQALMNARLKEMEEKLENCQ